MLNPVHLKVLASVARHSSVTEAAKELHYSQPSVSHHLARLEAATGVKLVQRVGRGIRLTPEGRLLANRAAEIIGRIDAATNELAAQVGLRTGQVRLAANASVLSTLVPRAAATLAKTFPGLELNLIERHPAEALQMLRHGEIDVALIFRYADAPAEDDAFRLVHIGEDSIYLISRHPDDTLDNHRDSPWIGGCERCQEELLAVCRRAGFTPRIGSLSDDMTVVQAFVAAGIGVTTLSGLALQAHRHPGIHASKIPHHTRQLHAATYGDPPDPPATTALLKALQTASHPEAP
ncbi:DNA-binding transcriptional LysR family regulator [Kribbella voronezhensis]|uniref:DNA-binding transcriptional LysR family regulator n=1 Tax=Kribbella voronezhensis TaxID=2512212 RepID=A0A4R7ST90_9ACTN|nr:LysR family transcriptional regulator [Kribbella voronezhensis]TDU82401.1 DNA-binding transcriptional LysR family regulator [Kribbella voronezhensis]